MLVVFRAIFLKVIRNMEQIFHWSIRKQVANLQNAIKKLRMFK